VLLFRLTRRPHVQDDEDDERQSELEDLVEPGAGGAVWKYGELNPSIMPHAASTWSALLLDHDLPGHPVSCVRDAVVARFEVPRSG
jgi:hypothetical protein